MRRTLLLLAAGAALACGQLPTASETRTAPAAPRNYQAPVADPAGERLYLGSLRDGSILRVVNPLSGTVERTLPHGAPSPDWSRLYSVYRAGNETRLGVVNTESGQIELAVPVPEWVQSAQLSAGGRWLALTAKPDQNARLTRFQLRDAALQANPIDVELPGAFAFDGLSGDGQRLYLLEWRGAERYQVRLFQVGRGLQPFVIADKNEVGQLMSGTAAGSLTSGDGQMQLTLYERSARHQAFVHALPIGSAHQFAYCIDLPAPDAGWVLSAAPDGRRFYAANQVSGELVELSLTGAEQPPQVRKSQVRTQPAVGLVRPAEAKEAGPTAAAVDPQGMGLFVAAGGGVVRVDTRDLKKDGQASLLDGEQLWSLGFGRSGWLYGISEGGRLVRIDPNRLTVAWSSGPNFPGLGIAGVG